MTARRRRPHCRGRRVLLWTAAVFVFGQLSSGWALDNLWPQIRNPYMHQVIAHVEAQPTSPTAIFFGSSRFGCLLSGPELTRSIQNITGDSHVWATNASMPNGDIIFSERILLELLRRGVRPRYAVFEMTPPSITAHNPWIMRFRERLLGWSDLPAHFADLVRDEQLAPGAQSLLVPLFSYRGLICKALTSNWACCNQPPDALLPPGRTAARFDIGADTTPVDALDWDAGARPHEHVNDPLEASRKAIPNLNKQLDDYRPGGTLVAALERVVGLCRAHGVEPILLGVPVTKTFRDCVTVQMQASYQEFLSQFCHQQGISFVDYQAALSDDCFFDFHHGTKQGCELFSRVVAEDILAPSLEGQQPAAKYSAPLAIQHQ
jgi:hypothetical protein